MDPTSAPPLPGDVALSPPRHTIAARLRPPMATHRLNKRPPPARHLACCPRLDGGSHRRQPRLFGGLEHDCPRCPPRICGRSPRRSQPTSPAIGGIRCRAAGNGGRHLVPPGFPWAPRSRWASVTRRRLVSGQLCPRTGLGCVGGLPCVADHTRSAAATMGRRALGRPRCSATLLAVRCPLVLAVRPAALPLHLRRWQPACRAVGCCPLPPGRFRPSRLSVPAGSRHGLTGAAPVARWGVTSAQGPLHAWAAGDGRCTPSHATSVPPPHSCAAQTSRKALNIEIRSSGLQETKAARVR
jgi:hypothetical protein